MSILEKSFIDFVGGDDGGRFDRFRKFAEVVTANISTRLGIDALGEGNQGGRSDKKFYCFRLSKEHWKSVKELEQCCAGDLNYWLHLELQYQPDNLVNNDSVLLFVHGETNPYYSQRKIPPECRDFYEKSYKPLMEELVLELHRQMKMSALKAGWKPENHLLRKASCKISVHSTISEIRQWFEAQCRVMTPIIDETLDSVLGSDANNGRAPRPSPGAFGDKYRVRLDGHIWHAGR